ncbi:hypothetical protein H0H81_000746 [Sphagnurus paluster]|uniref:Uncharacterized protein n=1 Tax=Sphagnurus paluster TaxID=117069 RepID=A0A9P7GIU4_9AGAR|nr:hypothetical protein H0H81_000746 [Sphagnurus paluster]
MDENQETAYVPHPSGTGANRPGLVPDANPMESPYYLLSPLETISESLDDYDFEYISIHDIIEAYSLLSRRIRSQACLILRAGEMFPALAPFKDHAGSLARALKRDIRRALADPSRDLQRSPALFSSYRTEVSMNDHDFQNIRNLSTLCHHSLRVVSDVFAFKSLYSLFPVQDIEDLLNDLLKIALTVTLPSHSTSKTWSLVFWTLQSQNLPSSMLSNKKGDIVTALRHALNGQKGLQAKIDGFKAIHSLLKSHIDHFSGPLTGFLPTILSNLIAEDAGCRIQAANALSGITLAKLHMLRSSQFPHESTSKDIHIFLKNQIPHVEYSQGELRLPILIAQGFSSSKRKDSIWAVVVIACLIVLSDHHLFLRKTLRFCFTSFKPAFNHRRREIRALHTPIWRCLLWSFSRVPFDHTWLQPEDPNISDENIGIRGRAFRTLKEDLSYGKGVSLVEILLVSSGVDDRVDASGANVARALLVVKSMILGEALSSSRDGLLVLHRLVSAIGTPNQGSTQSDDYSGCVHPSPDLFNGTLLDATSEAFKGSVRAIAEVKIDCIRQLSEQEIVEHWDILAESWIIAMDQALGDSTTPFSNELFDIWQSLLLVQADPTQQFGHLTASACFAGRVARIVNRFLVHPADLDQELQRLTAAKKLWSVMKNVFSASWLPAESILAAVLAINFTLQDDAVRSLWSHLCADLISTGIPTVMHVIFTRSERTEGREVTRQLWTVLAKTWQFSNEMVNWQQLTAFLSIPFK